MKDLEYYMSLPYQIVIEPDVEEGGYTVYCPELKGCITCVDKMSEIEEMINDAKRNWFETMLEEGNAIPEPKVYMVG
ncbi:MAG: type II toxin-antitoxin system HicB family antitoxin [Lachnospiraceae bacterium]|nr:type II toxin-antitoxin system HicB family antitoxin [Lachnospiraceae bacterium]